MVFTNVQKLRKIRARNKGMNRKLATAMRDISEWLDKKGSEEFTRREAKSLRILRDLLTKRLDINVLAESTQDILDGKQKTR